MTADAFRNEIALMLEHLGHTVVSGVTDIVTTKGQGKHVHVNCEACHGPLANHANDPASVTPGLPDTSSDQTGWTIGAGLEASLARNWTAKVEYLYVDLGSFNCGLNCGAGLVTDNVSFHANLLRAGVNYKF